MQDAVSYGIETQLTNLDPGFLNSDETEDLPSIKYVYIEWLDQLSDALEQKSQGKLTITDKFMIEKVDYMDTSSESEEGAEEGAEEQN
jgi:hypothetical protein